MTSKRVRSMLSIAAAGTMFALLAAGPHAQDEAAQAQNESRLQQDLSRRSRVAEPQEPQEPEFLRQNPAISIEFEGGSVRDYVAVLRRAAPNVNIMLDNDAGNVEVPAFELRGVMLIDALKILEDLQPEHQGYALSLDEFASGPSQIYAPVFRVTAIKQRPPQPPLQTSVWSVRQLIAAEIASADILGAVEAALALQDDLGPPEVRFHEETGLLIARAHPEQIEAIAQVIDNLQKGLASDRRSDDVQQLSSRLQQASREIEHAEMNRRATEQELQEQIRQNERLQARIEELERRLGVSSEDGGG